MIYAVIDTNVLVAAAKSHKPDSGPLATLPDHWSFCPKIGLSVTSRAVLSTFPALVPGLQFPYAVPIRNSGNKGPQEGPLGDDVMPGYDNPRQILLRRSIML